MATPPSITLATPYFFFYGTLQSPAVCSRVVSGTTTQQVVSLQQMKPAVVHGYKRCPGTDRWWATMSGHAHHPATVRGHDYPAMIRGTQSDRVTGMLCLVSDPTWQHRLDEFEGFEYAREIVTATTAAKELPAYAYLWVAGEQYLELDQEWSTARFLADKEQLWAYGDPERLLENTSSS